MDLSRPPQVVLGLDLGAVTTRASLFGLQSGKYGLLGQTEAPTSLGPDRHLGEGVADALAALQEQTKRKLLNDDGSLIQPFTDTGEGLDQIVLASDAGPRLRTVVLGLSKGRFAAGGPCLGGFAAAGFARRLRRAGSGQPISAFGQAD